jgi:hypothetical protein
MIGRCAIVLLATSFLRAQAPPAFSPMAYFQVEQLGVVAERSEVAVFVLRHHTRMIANQDGSVYSTRCSAANAVYRRDQWQRRSKHTELES